MKKLIWLLIMVIVLAILYFTLRLYHFTSLPLFTDEAIYIRWAQIGLGDPLYRFFSLTDGKQPLFIWMMYPFLKLFEDPVIAGRMVSVFSGFFTMIGLGLVTYTLFKKRSWAFLTMLLYIASPFAQVLDRMALYDSMVGMLFVWALFLAILFVRNIRLANAYNLGFLLGAENLTKLPTFLSVLLLPLTLFIFNFSKKEWKKDLAKWIGLSAIALLISQIMYGIVRLSPLPNVTNVKNTTFFYPISEWIHHPFLSLSGNLHGMTIPLVEYLTIPYVLVLLVAVIYFKKDWREKALLFSYFLVPFLGFAFLGKEVFSRYFFFMSLPLFVLMSWGLGYMIDIFVQRLRVKGASRYAVAGFIAFVVLFYPAYISISFAKDPIHAPIPQGDKGQYVTAWTSGWGLKETVAYLEGQAQSGPIYVATEGGFGLYPQGVELYVSKNPNIAIKGYYWEIKKDFPKELAEKAKVMPTYFVFYQPCPNGLCSRPGDAPPGWPLQQVQEFTKAGTDTRVVIYQVEAITSHENHK